MTHALFEAAREAMDKAHCPYSAFPVGAAVLCDDVIYSGCNIENASFPEGCCAETTAIGHMIMAGATRIDAVAVVARKQPLVTPCGGCRQRLAEFGSANTSVHLCDLTGIQKTVTLGELLPHAFTDSALDHLTAKTDTKA